MLKAQLYRTAFECDMSIINVLNKRKAIVTQDIIARWNVPTYQIDLARVP